MPIFDKPAQGGFVGFVGQMSNRVICRKWNAPGVVGTVASEIGHSAGLPPGKSAIFRAPLPLDDGTTITLRGSDRMGSLCPGDSGSGLVTFEGGGAIVRGIASAVSITSDCKTPSGFIDFTKED